ncbi:L-asparaginase 2 [Colletotrichum sidae]|uniref:asparaginase n=1 Tax=Colletotrichum sidae TaxID=1347389 RepID=A0A4R8TKQ7_9PEZI|nr:L-asparaginase 2 [Colletotrichum sidae]
MTLAKHVVSQRAPEHPSAQPIPPTMGRPQIQSIAAAQKISKRIAFVSTGGTIASISTDKYDLLDYNATDDRVTGKTIIQATGIADLFANGENDIVFTDAFKDPIDSTAITAHTWLQLADTCYNVAAQTNVDGIVIGHGTATLEETAWLLSLVTDLPIPIVVTGSMRPLNGISSDAAANLVAAFRAAAAHTSAPQPDGPAVLVVLNDEIHSPRCVAKTHTLRLGAFQSPWCGGPVGLVDGDAVNLLRRVPHHGVFFDRALLRDLPRVDVVYSYVGADGTAVEAFVEAGARGIVSAGFGPGLGSPQETEAFAKAVEAGVVVVQSSRVGAGTVVDSRKHRRLGIVAGNDLNPQKARLLLALCLAAGHDREPGKIESVFRSV